MYRTVCIICTHFVWDLALFSICKYVEKCLKEYIEYKYIEEYINF